MQQYSLVWWLRLTATILVLTSWPKIEFHLLHGCSLGELSNKKRYSMCATTTLPSLFGLKCPGMAHHGILPLQVEVHNTRIQSFIKSPLLPIKNPFYQLPTRCRRSTELCTKLTKDEEKFPIAIAIFKTLHEKLSWGFFGWTRHFKKNLSWLSRDKLDITREVGDGNLHDHSL